MWSASAWSTPSAAPSLFWPEAVSPWTRPCWPGWRSGCGHCPPRPCPLRNGPSIPTTPLICSARPDWSTRPSFSASGSTPGSTSTLWTALWITSTATWCRIPAMSSALVWSCLRTDLSCVFPPRKTPMSWGSSAPPKRSSGSSMGPRCALRR